MDLKVIKSCEGIHAVTGPLIFVKTIPGVSFGEIAEIVFPDDSVKMASVVDINEKFTILQLYGNTAGIDPKKTTVRFLQQTLHLGVSLEMLGRIFDGIGNPIDGIRMPDPEFMRDINGAPLNPVERAYPHDFIQTGISAIDIMNTLVRGQKLPIFSAAGLPHNYLAAQIAAQAKSKTGNPFAVVFAAMGIRHDDAEFFIDSFKETGALKNTVLFLNLADDPAIERLVTPRVALTAAEYLAYDKGMDVLVILTDMTSYAEALREVAAAKGEVPSRKGFPGYMYSDLSTIYERAGLVKGRPGSVTQVPILTMPGDDITHPIPDLTGYITEGQIVLDRNLFGQNILPPIALIPSLSRLMKDAIGANLTREDHPKLFMQLYAAYARAIEIRTIAAIVSEDEMSDLDRLYLKFGHEFENTFINQGFDESRSLEESLNLAWKILSILPKSELTAMTSKELLRYYVGNDEE
ncbi:MAG: V-type ATP synthase subunit B [Brevinemataceae bacterium]